MPEHAFGRGAMVKISETYATGMYGDGTPMLHPYRGMIAEVVSCAMDEHRHDYTLKFTRANGRQDVCAWFPFDALIAHSDPA